MPFFILFGPASSSVGLRPRECLQLGVKDIDFSYQQITVRSVKGEKDRMIVLPPNCSKMDMTCANRAGTVGTQRREDNDDLYPCSKPQRQRHT